MSKSLKQMAYDTIEAHQETIADLRTQLAKANERVKGLELTVKGLKEFIAVARVMFLDLDEMEVNSKEYTDLLSDLFTLFCGGDEFHKYVNKFAIEKKIEALKSFASYAKGDDWEDAYLQEAIKIEIEQLRKEQE